ncbi:hypothetical protein MTO96_007976 [Rhipicephalus appendiculatus]
MVLQEGPTNPIQLQAGHFPLEAPFADIKDYRNGFFAALSIAFCLPLVWRVRDITTEIEFGLKEMQEVMGLSTTEFWLGHFFAALPISMIEATLATAVILFQEKEYIPMRNVTVYKSEDLDFPLNPTTEDDLSPSATTSNVSTSTSHKFVRVYPVVRQETHYLENADASLVAACFLFFCFCHTVLALLVACVFPHGRWAMVIAFAIFFMFPCLDGDQLGFIFGTSLFTYLSTDRTHKLRTAFYPNVALSTAMKIIGIFDDFEKSAHWKIISKAALNLDNVTVKDMMAVMLATFLISALLVGYLSQVLPGTTSRPQRLLFPITKSYWYPPKPSGADTEAEELSPLIEERFETAPSLKVAIECKNIHKAFDNTVALKQSGHDYLRESGHSASWPQRRRQDDSDEHFNRYA